MDCSPPGSSVHGIFQARILEWVAMSFSRFSVATFINLSSLVAQVVKNLPAMQETQVRSLGPEDPLEKDMATHSSILARRIPRAEEPGGYSPWGRKELDTTEWHTHTHTHTATG